MKPRCRCVFALRPPCDYCAGKAEGRNEEANERAQDIVHLADLLHAEYEKGRAKGRAEERADVVARLRREFHDLTLDGQTVDAIAAGDHEGDAKYFAAEADGGGK